MKETLVISAFPGVGKTYTATNEKEKFEGGVMDSDSSEFSWIKDANGKNTDERNPKFPQNYINHIKENIGKYDVIFVSSHKAVREAMAKAGIDYVLVYPSIHKKKDYLERYKARGNNKVFVDTLEANWDTWIMQCIKDENCVFKAELPTFLSCKYLNYETIDLIKIMM